MRLIPRLALVLASLMAPAAHAADELLETLAQKGVLTAEEYQKLKEARKNSLSVNTDDGFRIQTQDGATTFQIGTLQQLDIYFYDDDNQIGPAGRDLSDGTEFRRSRISLSGQFLRDWQFRVEYEFSGPASVTGVTDATVTYNGFKPLTFTAGNMKPPFAMEALMADKGVTFMERALPFAFANAGSTRVPGLMAATSGGHWSAAAGFFGEPLNTPAVVGGEEAYSSAARVTWAPVMTAGWLVHVGGGAIYRVPVNQGAASSARFNTRPESNGTGTRFFADTGAIGGEVDHTLVENLEFVGAWKALSLQAEYYSAQLARKTGGSLDFDGWYTQAAWTITGEARPYNASRGLLEPIKPARELGKDGGLGAWEIAMRLSGIDLNDGAVSGGQERNGTVGLNWYLNRYMRMSLNTIKVFNMTGGVVNGDTPTIYQMRLQFAY